MEKCTIIRANLHCHWYFHCVLTEDQTGFGQLRILGAFRAETITRGGGVASMGTRTSHPNDAILIPLIVDPIINQYTRRTPCCCALLWYKVLTPSSLGKPVSAFLAALVWATSAAAAGLWLVESVSRDHSSQLWLVGRFCGSYKYDVTTRGYKKTDKYSGRTSDLFILTSLLQVECTNCDIDIYNIQRRQLSKA